MRMLSYRHGFHAGNHADVLKHAAYVFVLDYLQSKEAPLLLLDTHAGAGIYDLTSANSLKLREFESGVARLLKARGPVPDLVERYLELVRQANPGQELQRYPGSPMLAALLRRPQDRAVFCELHTTDHAFLAEVMDGKRRVLVLKEDGLKGLLAQVPPAEKRALVLIDPSYEIKTDYEQVASALARAWAKFPTGCYIVWYPVIERSRCQAMAASLVDAGLRKLYRVELGLVPDAPGRGMTGSGLFVVNPPYTLPAAAEAALPWLARVLDAKGPLAAEWLAEE
jgi:23S rRNA (adenine2030-N6)-methyltransferase